jgi:hypothetical protein
MIAARYASLLAFAQSRAFCPRGEGNGIDNSCGSKTMSAPDGGGGGGGGSRPPTAPDTWGNNTWDNGSSIAGLAHIGNIKVPRSRTAADIAAVASKMGISGPAELLTIGACNLKDAKVEINGIGTNIVMLRADVPAGNGTIKIDTALTLGENGSTINYGYLALDEAARKQALADPSIQTAYGGKIYAAMLASMEAAEKAGFVEADTLAEGHGPGNTNGRRTDLQGYRLWGRFGFDGEIPRSFFSNVGRKGVDVASALTPEHRKIFERSGELSLQQLLSTKQGEKIWKQWGVPIQLTFDFTKKESIGYQRYQKMLALSRRASDRRSFFEYVYGLELRDDPSLWSGFVEQRGFCPNGEGNGVTNTCSTKDSPAQETEEDDPPPALHLLAEGDADAPQKKMKSGDGVVTVFDRKGMTTSEYLDDIECHGRNCGLDVNFEDAKALQPNSDIADDWSPLDAYVGPGVGYFTGQADRVGSDSIDFHGLEYGTIDDEMASQLRAEKEREASEEWDSFSEEEKDKHADSFDGGLFHDSDNAEDRRATAKQEWLRNKGYEIDDEIDEIRQEARLAAVEQMKKELESALAADTIECCLQLYRGIRVSPSNVEEMIRSGYVTHEGANSWTTSRFVAKAFGGTQLLIVTRKPRVGHIFASNAHDEKEVVRPPSRMRILGVVRTSTGTVLHVDEDEDYKEA